MRYFNNKDVHLDGNRLEIPRGFEGKHWIVSLGSDDEYNFLELYPAESHHEGRRVGRRFTLLPDERSHLGVTRNDSIVVLGQDTHLEVWKKSTYDEWDSNALAEIRTQIASSAGRYSIH